MSAPAFDVDSDVVDKDELPTFETEYLFDNDDAPTEVTIFRDEPEKLSTQWITVNKSCAVPLEDVR